MNYSIKAFSGDYELREKYHASAPKILSPDEIEEDFMKVFSAQYQDPEIIAMRKNLLLAAYQAIQSCGPALIAAGFAHASTDSQGKAFAKANPVALAAAHRLIVLQDLRQPTVTQVVECARKIELEIKENGGESAVTG